MSEAATVEQLQAQLADITSQFDKVKSKNDELLTEAKRAKDQMREAEEATRLEAEEKNKASNNFKELHASSELEREKLQTELDTLKGGIAKEKRTNAATSLAAELAEGSNVKLLAEFVTKRLKFTDGILKVTNEAGELTVSTLDDLKKEFQGDARYASLLKGNQSSGGGASGGSKSGGATKELTRSEFETKSPADRMKFIKDGGVVT